MDKQPVGQLPDLTQSNNDDEIMVITNSEYNQLKKEKISDFITDLQSTNTNNSLTTGSDGKLFVSKTINASDVDGVLSLDNIPQLSTNKLPETGISADNYSYPSSITVNDRGQVVSITEGSAAEAGAYLDQSQITNCILEIPQNIKYTLNNDTFTLKAGSILTVPYGTTDQSATYPVGATFLNNNFKVVKTYFNNNKFFVQAEVQADINYKPTWLNGERTFITINCNTNYLIGNMVNSATSGPTTPDNPSQGALWYDTTNNYMKQYANGEWNTSNALPLLIITGDNTGITAVLDVFNGMGYIGNTVFVNPDVKVLITTAVNDDGSKVNTAYTTDSVYLATSSVTNIEFFIALTPASFNTEKNCYLVGSSTYSISPVPPENTTRWLNSQNGLFYILKDGVWALNPQVHLGFGTISDGVITEFNQYGTVSVADDQTVLHKWGNETAYGNKTFEGKIIINSHDDNQPVQIITDSNVLQTVACINRQADYAAIPSTTYVNGARVISIDKNGQYYGFFQTIANSNILKSTMGSRRRVDNIDYSSVISACVDQNGNTYGEAPTYTANYADSSSKIVTTQFLTNRWTTSKATTTSSASKARPAVVIENYLNGTSGYRVWSDGYCEQWGRTVFKTNGTVTVNLFKTMKNTAYTCQITLFGNTSGPGAVYGSYFSCWNLKTTSFQHQRYTDQSVQQMWKVSGYLAEGQY